MNYWLEISCPYLWVYQDLLILVIYDKLLKLAIDKHVPRKCIVALPRSFNIYTEKHSSCNERYWITISVLPFYVVSPILTGFLIPINGYDY